jgi:hypothetical protein
VSQSWQAGNLVVIFFFAAWRAGMARYGAAGFRFDDQSRIAGVCREIRCLRRLVLTLRARRRLHNRSTATNIGAAGNIALHILTSGILERCANRTALCRSNWLVRQTFSLRENPARR